MQTANDPRAIHKDQVQFFLDQLSPMEMFTVIFIKKSTGEQRKITGYLDPNSPQSRKQTPPVITEDGWKSFDLNNVLFIGPANQTFGGDW